MDVQKCFNSGNYLSKEKQLCSPFLTNKISDSQKIESFGQEPQKESNLETKTKL